MKNRHRALSEYGGGRHWYRLPLAFKRKSPPSICQPGRIYWVRSLRRDRDAGRNPWNNCNSTNAAISPSIATLFHSIVGISGNRARGFFIAGMQGRWDQPRAVG
jgi:hypothetical protein